MRRTFATLAALACLAALAGCATGGVQDDSGPGDPAVGLQVAQDLCSSCHAVGRTGDSPTPAAPVFRTILAQYNPGALTVDLKRAAAISHRNMPTFVMTDQHAEDLVAYLVSIQPRETE
jgi:cytochrome c